MVCLAFGSSLRQFSYTLAVAVGHIPPDVEKTSGEKDPCSISLILCS